MGLSKLIRILVFCTLPFLSLIQGYSLRNSELPTPRIVVVPADSKDPAKDEVVSYKPPNSNLIVGETEEIKVNSRITLECEAAYPVQFVYSGDGMPEYTTNTSQSDNNRQESDQQLTKPRVLFLAQLFLGYGRALGSYDSGKYTCRSLQDARKAVHYYLFVYDGKLFIRQDGETVYYRRNDPSVRIPCSVTHPNAVVSLQKSVNGLVQCPLNDSISFEPTSGFQVKMSNRFDVAGTYVCTAGYMGTYQAMQYVVMSENDGPSDLNTPHRQPCRRDVDCANNEACLNNGHCGSPCANSCGQNTSCRVVNHLANCQCLPGYVGDPYVSCSMSPRPDPVQEDPCQPFPCGSNTRCENHNGIAKCSCAPGYQGDPYYRCYRRNDPCNPNPCGPHSVCVNRNSYASCSCSQGFIGTPPHCRAECEVDHHCNYNQVCTQYRCRNPCEGACNDIPNTQCRVINRRPVCARYQSRCPTGHFGRDCSQIYERETEPVEQQEPSEPPKSPCVPSPCGTNAECVIQNAFNSVINQTNQIALCQCGPGQTGNADMECYPIEDIRKIVTHEEVRTNDAALEPDVAVNDTSPGNTTVSNSTTSTPAPEKVQKKCGTNAISILSADGKSVCQCPVGYTGLASIECHAVIMQMQDDQNVGNDLVEPEYCDSTNSSITCGANAYCVLQNGTETCMCMRPFNGDPNVGCELECQTDSDCPNEFTCYNQSGRCVDPCEPSLQMFFKQCGRDAYCKVEDHKPVCYCPQDLPHGDPNVHCKEKSWMPNHLAPTLPPACERKEDMYTCGNNTECRLFHDKKSYCVCTPGFYGDPYDTKGPGCEQGLQCRNTTQCPSAKECVNGRCLDACKSQRLDCGNHGGCRVDENHQAKCICNIGTIRNPNGACEPVMGALAERLAIFRSFEDF